MKKSLLALLAVFSIGIWGCSDDNSTSNNDSGDYYPMTQGNYYVYNDYQTDTNGYRTDAPPTRDSVVVMGTETKFEKTATKVASFIWDDNQSAYGEAEYEYYYKEGDKVYLHSSAFVGFNDLPLPVELPIEIPEQWFLIVNPSASAEWELFTQAIEEPISFSGMDGKVKGTAKITCKKGTNSNVSTPALTSVAQQYSVELSFSGAFIAKIGIVEQEVTKINYKLTLNQYFAKNVGVIKREALPSSYTIPLIKTTPVKIGGSESVLVNYHVMTK